MGAPKQLGHFVGGKHRPGTSGRTSPVFDPATGAVTAEVQLASVEEVDEAVAVARDAFAEWRTVPLGARAEVLFRVRELLDARRHDLAAIITAEHGKVLADAPSREAAGAVAELVKKGNCASCHGTNFSKPIDPSYPKIAGQHADYLFVALKQYKAENNAAVGRSNAVMGAIAKQFSNNELKALANYMASVDGELKTIPESKFR